MITGEEMVKGILEYCEEQAEMDREALKQHLGKPYGRSVPTDEQFLAWWNAPERGGGPPVPIWDYNQQPPRIVAVANPWVWLMQQETTLNGREFLTRHRAAVRRMTDKAIKAAMPMFAGVAEQEAV